MKLSSTLLVPFVLSLALLVSASPYSRPRSRHIPSSEPPHIPSATHKPSTRRRLTPRHADDGCDLTQTYTATYTPENAPKISEQGQSGTNQCGTGSSQDSMCQNVYGACAAPQAPSNPRKKTK